VAQRCSENPGEPPKAWRAGASFGAFRSTLELGGVDVGIEQTAAIATLDYRRDERWTLQLGLGGIAGGALTAEGRRFPIYPGFVASFGASYLLYRGEGWKPFVLISAEASFSRARTADAALTAGDARLGAMAGETFGRFTPYVGARLFGGPVLWQLDGADLVGGDRYHYQFAAGAVVSLPGSFDLSVEVAPLGEQRLSAGAGYSF